MCSGHPNSCAFVLCLALAAGCVRPPVADVSGRVTIAGRSPDRPGLTATMMSTDGTPRVAPVEADGTYTVKGVPLGLVYIRVNYLPPTDAVYPSMARRKTGAAATDAKVDTSLPPSYEYLRAAILETVPLRFHNRRTSGLTLTVTADGPNKLDIDVTP